MFYDQNILECKSAPFIFYVVFALFIYISIRCFSKLTETTARQYRTPALAERRKRNMITLRFYKKKIYG